MRIPGRQHRGYDPDVDGVYTTDPRVVPGAVKLDEITYDEMLELASRIGAGGMDTYLPSSQADNRQAHALQSHGAQSNGYLFASAQEHVHLPYRAGNQVMVVLSAQGDTTDDLISKAQEINPKASKRVALNTPSTPATGQSSRTRWGAT